MRSTVEVSVALSDNPNTRPLIDGEIEVEGLRLISTAVFAASQAGAVRAVVPTLQLPAATAGCRSSIARPETCCTISKARRIGMASATASISRSRATGTAST